MKFNVYLHRNVADLLLRYGDSIDTVVNNILNEMELRDEPMVDLPPAPPRDNVRRLSVDVTNKAFLDLSDIFGQYSGRVSLRRIIYYFYDNEKYIEYGWRPNYEGKDKRLIYLSERDRFERALKDFAGAEFSKEVQELLTNIDKIEEKVNEKWV